MPKKKGPLASPFVPAEEQPYPIPENWCWTRLKVLVEASKEKTNDFSNGDTKYVGLEHIEKDGGIIGYSSATEVKSLKAIFHVGQILYGKLRPYLNKHDIAGFEGVCSTDILVFDTKNCADSRYVNYFFNQRYFIEYAVSNSKGINLPRVSEAIILEAICPLPPLTEQRRIVARIESLFAKLDEAKKKTQAVVDGFELRKSVILHKAFTGELTEQWRKEHGVGLDSWHKITLEKCLLPMETRKPTGKFFRYIDIDSIDNKRQRVREPKVVETTKAPSRASRAVQEGNILFSMVRPYLKNIALVDDTMNDCIASTGFYVCRCKDNILPVFLYELLCSKDAIDYLMQFMKGDNSPSIKKDDLLKMEIVLPSINEQMVLCNEIKLIADMEQQAKAAAESVLTRIEAMKKAILARAFRGELGTNDPAEESAAELLKSTFCSQSEVL